MTTPVLGLTELSNTSGERSTIIDTVRVLDAMWGRVASANININTPPTSPVDGTSALISSAPTGSFSGFAGHLALFIGTGWQFVSPDNIGFVQTDTGPYEPNGTLDGWVPLTLPAGSPLTTKGDLLTYNNGDVRLAVGANGQVLVANSATPTGLEWVTQTLGGGGGSALTLENNGNPLSTNVTKLNFTNFTITEPNPDEFNITAPNSSGGSTVAVTADRTYYVRSDGTRTNLTSETDGTTDTSQDAFGNLQIAIDQVSRLLANNHIITIAVGSGTWPRVDLRNVVGSNLLILQGVAGTIFRGFSAVNVASLWELRNCTITGQASQYTTIALQKSVLQIGSGVVFKTGGEGIILDAAYQSFVRFIAGFTLDGGTTDRGFNSNDCSNIVFLDGGTITLLNTPSFSLAFAYAANNATIRIFNNTFSGLRGGTGFATVTGGQITSIGTIW